MSHPEQLGFFALCAEANKELLSGGRLLEIGSYDVNGSVRRVFDGVRDYVGVDLTEGAGVDLVAYGHEVDEPDGSFDAVISGECFEHDPHWRETFANMCRLARPGGIVAFTCASSGRPEHGTRRTDGRDSPGTQAAGLDYYRNLREIDFLSIDSFGDWFQEFRFWYLPTSFDLYFIGVRRGSHEAPISGEARRGILPDSAEVRALSRLMPFPHRLVRAPLRVMAKLLAEPRYQAVATRYWRILVRLQSSVAGDAFVRCGREPSSVSLPDADPQAATERRP
jgi:SAM-dependent methyltransferase